MCAVPVQVCALGGVKLCSFDHLDPLVASAQPALGFSVDFKIPVGHLLEALAQFQREANESAANAANAKSTSLQRPPGAAGASVNVNTTTGSSTTGTSSSSSAGPPPGIHHKPSSSTASASSGAARAAAVAASSCFPFSSGQQLLKTCRESSPNDGPDRSSSSSPAETGPVGGTITSDDAMGLENHTTEEVKVLQGPPGSFLEPGKVEAGDIEAMESIRVTSPPVLQTIKVAVPTTGRKPKNWLDQDKPPLRPLRLPEIPGPDIMMEVYEQDKARTAILQYMPNSCIDPVHEQTTVGQFDTMITAVEDGRSGMAGRLRHAVGPLELRAFYQRRPRAHHTKMSPVGALGSRLEAPVSRATKGLNLTVSAWYSLGTKMCMDSCSMECHKCHFMARCLSTRGVPGCVIGASCPYCHYHCSNKWVRRHKRQEMVAAMQRAALAQAQVLAEEQVKAQEEANAREVAEV